VVTSDGPPSQRDLRQPFLGTAQQSTHEDPSPTRARQKLNLRAFPAHTWTTVPKLTAAPVLPRCHFPARCRWVRQPGQRRAGRPSRVTGWPLGIPRRPVTPAAGATAPTRSLLS